MLPIPIRGESAGGVSMIAVAESAVTKSGVTDRG